MFLEADCRLREGIVEGVPDGPDRGIIPASSSDSPNRTKVYCDRHPRDESCDPPRDDPGMTLPGSECRGLADRRFDSKSLVCFDVEHSQLTIRPA